MAQDPNESDSDQIDRRPNFYGPNKWKDLSSDLEPDFAHKYVNSNAKSIQKMLNKIRKRTRKSSAECSGSDFSLDLSDGDDLIRMYLD